MLLLEKLKTGEEIYKMLNTAIEKENDERNKAILKRIIVFILGEKLNSEDKEELLKKLEGGEKDMVLEVIRKENENLIKKGKQEGIKVEKMSIVMRMIKNKMDENTIKLMTEITQKELDKIKQTINE